MRKLAALRNRSPFAGDQPLGSISLCVYGDSTGLRYWNGNNDPMPIKTLNNNGLKVYEETEDYFIQIDKDAVITTVEKYVPGTFSIYNERLKDVEKSRGLLALHKITWDTNIDNAKLLLDVNKEQLEKLANTPILLPDEEVRPILEVRAIPTNYLCCFRVDKKTGEMYVSEAYENLVSNIDMFDQPSNKCLEKKDGLTYKIINIDTNSEGWRQQFFKNNLGVHCVSFEFSDAVESIVPIGNKLYGDYKQSVWGGYTNGAYLFDSDGTNNTYPLAIRNRAGINILGTTIKFQITKNSTEKPYVKTIMPNGKMGFLSSATELTHTFLTKGDGVITFGSGSFSLRGEKVLQLLVYKALLTEEQKKAELAKDIKLR